MQMECRSVLSSPSEQVREEIQRFESIHPYIYKAYNLIDSIENDVIRNNLEQQMVFIEDAFIRSQEWTLTRNVPILRLGVIGSLDSGKTPLIHRYLTGGYRVRESAEGGRFKKDLVLEGRSHLLLIRDEGNQPPDANFTHWLDGALVVYSVTSRQSLDVAITYLKTLARFRPTLDFPAILVGTTEGLSTSSRVISEEEAKKYARERNWLYLEVCSTTGHKVEHVFREVCLQVLKRTPDVLVRKHNTVLPHNQGSLNRQRNSIRNSQVINPEQMSKAVIGKTNYDPIRRQGRNDAALYSHQRSVSAAPVFDPNVRFDHDPTRVNGHATVSGNRFRNSGVNDFGGMEGSYCHFGQGSKPTDNFAAPLPYTRSVTSYGSSQKASFLSPAGASTSHLPTPSSTPNVHRKNYRRISSMFSRKEPTEHLCETTIGHGRAIPLKQGFLHKKGNSGLTSKKKYVCLFEDGKLCYYNNMKAFQEQVPHAKEIYLGLATVKVKLSKASLQKRRSSLLNIIKPGKENLGPTVSGTLSNAAPSALDRVSIASESALPSVSTPGDISSGGLSDFDAAGNSEGQAGHETETVKQRKKQRRLGTFGVKPVEDDDDVEFAILTSDERRVEFIASSMEERDEWVHAIEAQIARELGSQSAQSKGRPVASRSEIDQISQLPGNNVCADCGNSRPCWAVVNLGTLICIECSGVHRKMGSHVSKVRSLDLDQWPCDYLLIMEKTGNLRANAVWEHAMPKGVKPTPDAKTTDRERFISDKYVKRIYLGRLSNTSTSISLLYQAVQKADFAEFYTCLPHCSVEELSSLREGKTVAHLAARDASPEFLLLLIWFQADCTSKDSSDCTVADYARGNPSMDEYVLSEVMACTKSCVGPSVESARAEAQSDEAANNNIPVSVDLFRDTVHSTTTIHEEPADGHSFLNDVPHSVL